MLLEMRGWNAPTRLLVAVLAASWPAVMQGSISMDRIGHGTGDDLCKGLLSRGRWQSGRQKVGEGVGESMDPRAICLNQRANFCMDVPERCTSFEMGGRLLKARRQRNMGIRGGGSVFSDKTSGATAERSATSASGQGQGDESRPLPDGWASTTDAKGRTYFWNVETKQVTWARPERKNLIWDMFPVKALRPEDDNVNVTDMYPLHSDVQGGIAQAYDSQATRVVMHFLNVSAGAEAREGSIGKRRVGEDVEAAEGADVGNGGGGGRQGALINSSRGDGGVGSGRGGGMPGEGEVLVDAVRDAQRASGSENGGGGAGGGREGEGEGGCCGGGGGGDDDDDDDDDGGTKEAMGKIKGLGKGDAVKSRGLVGGSHDETRETQDRVKLGAEEEKEEKEKEEEEEEEEEEERKMENEGKGGEDEIQEWDEMCFVWEKNPLYTGPWQEIHFLADSNVKLVGRWWLMHTGKGSLTGLDCEMVDDIPYMHLFLVQGTWLFDQCNLRCMASTALKLCTEATVEFRHGELGGFGEGSECGDCIQVKDSSQLSIESSLISYADKHKRGLNAYDGGFCYAKGCSFVNNGFGVSVDGECHVRLEQCSIKMSRAAAFSCQYRGNTAMMELDNVEVEGMSLWFNADRPILRERNVSYYVEDSDVCSARYTKRQLAEMSIGADGSRTTNPNEECFVEFSE